MIMYINTNVYITKNFEQIHWNERICWMYGLAVMLKLHAKINFAWYVLWKWKKIYISSSDINSPQNKTIVSRPFATLVEWTKVRWTPTNFMFITILAKAKIGYTIVPIIIEIANMITFRETLMYSEVKFKFLCNSF